jgi:alpha-1,2-mannosyltransferase
MRMLGLNALVTALILAASLLFNNPLFRTIRHNQINLWVLDLSMVVLVFGLRYPILSGLSLALAAHLKIYTLTMLGPLLMNKKWKISLTAVLGILLLAILAHLTLWMQFGQNLIRDLPFDSLFRNNSFMGLSANFLHLIGLDFGLLPRILYLCLVIGALGLFIFRYLQRERQSASSASKITAHLVDAVALSLLISPLVWEHHYLFALPLIWWSVVFVKGLQLNLSASQISRPAILLAISALLMLVIPTFDLFPFSYHRLAGLCLWIWITMPGKIDLALHPHVPDYAFG